MRQKIPTSKHWKREPKNFQGLEKAKPRFPNSGKTGLKTSPAAPLNLNYYLVLNREGFTILTRP